ncbi:MAG: hypothetical protein QXG98_02950 [Candidatus Micrarchaeia archaeon]
MTRKGQAAMEYLMTYGWAILVIVIVLAALLYLGVFNIAGRTPEICTLPIGLQCPSFKLDTAGLLNVSITNGHPKTIIVSLARCTSDATFNASDWNSYTDIPDVTIPSADSRFVSFNCYTTGSTVATGAVGDTYRGKLYLRYAFSDEPGNYRVAIGDIVTKYQPA